MENILKNLEQALNADQPLNAGEEAPEIVPYAPGTTVAFNNAAYHLDLPLELPLFLLR